MITKYNNFILESKLDKYFNDEITYKDLAIDNYLLSTNESLTESIMSKIDSILLKAYEWSLNIVSKGKTLLNKILKVLSAIIKFINKLCGENKKVCALIVVFIIMITVSATSAYAAANPTDPNLPEIANAALGFIQGISSDLISDGISEKSIMIAESILTEIRETGQNVDYSHISTEAQALANSAMSQAESISSENPGFFEKLVDVGSKISSGFSRNVNGILTTIGKR
jgi:hypothetical protein